MVRITLADLESSARDFKTVEPRGLFYRAATVMVGLAIEKKANIDLAEALAVLLQTWNRAYYQYRRFTEQHFLAIEAMLNKSMDELAPLRPRLIESMTQADEGIIVELFDRFSAILGPVGAAKSLHLLAPDFFPLWDNEIANAYKTKKTGVGYLGFMKATLSQLNDLGGREAIQKVPGISSNPLKAIDEDNYVRITIRKRAKQYEKKKSAVKGV